MFARPPLQPLAQERIRGYYKRLEPPDALLLAKQLGAGETGTAPSAAAEATSAAVAGGGA